MIRVNVFCGSTTYERFFLTNEDCLSFLEELKKAHICLADTEQLRLKNKIDNKRYKEVFGKQQNYMRYLRKFKGLGLPHLKIEIIHGTH